MSEDDDSSEKSHDPTPKKLEDARKKGEFPRSQDANAAASYLGLLLAVIGGGAYAVSSGAQALTLFLSEPDRLTGRILGPGGSWVAGGMMLSVVVSFLAILLFPAAATLISVIAQRSFVVTPDKILPKMSRISVVSNAKQKFGAQGMVEFSKRVLKLSAIGTALVLLVSEHIDEIIGSVNANAMMHGVIMMDLMVAMLILVTLISVAIAIGDMLWQNYHHIEKNRMSHKELRDESKEAEGDPHMKSQRRQRAQEIANNQMLADVPTADVVIVNPTHYAVALKWSRSAGSAPTCVAKGVDEIAARIREAATEANVPIHSDPPTARALHAIVEIGNEIHPEHYKAVAEAIRFAEKVKADEAARALRS